MIASIAHGVPTDIDTQKLDEAFGVPETGARLAYSELAEVMGHPKADILAAFEKDVRAAAHFMTFDDVEIADALDDRHGVSQFSDLTVDQAAAFRGAITMLPAVLEDIRVAIDGNKLGTASMEDAATWLRTKVDNPLRHDAKQWRGWLAELTAGVPAHR